MHCPPSESILVLVPSDVEVLIAYVAAGPEVHFDQFQGW